MYTRYARAEYYLTPIVNESTWFETADWNIREVASFGLPGELVRSQMRYIEACTGCLDSTIEEYKA